MYTPPSNRVSEDAEIRRMVAEAGAAELITTGRDGYPWATLLPIIWTADVVLAHMARANPHWREIADGSPALLVCTGPQAYVSPGWQVTALTDRHERDRTHPWHVTDAPATFVEGQLRGIVGLELRIERVDGKAKLSQNRSAADQRGVIDGLATEQGWQAAAVADAMRAGPATTLAGEGADRAR